METKVIVMLQQLHLSYLLVIMEPKNQHVHSTSLRNSSTRISVHFGVNRELRTTLEAKKGQGGGDFTVTSLGGCLEQLVSIIKSTQTRRHSLKLAPTPPRCITPSSVAYGLRYRGQDVQERICIILRPPLFSIMVALSDCIRYISSWETGQPKSRRLSWAAQCWIGLGPLWPAISSLLPTETSWVVFLTFPFCPLHPLCCLFCPWLKARAFWWGADCSRDGRIWLLNNRDQTARRNPSSFVGLRIRYVGEGIWAGHELPLARRKPPICG